MKFKELRQASGMNQTDFAKYFNIPRRTVQNWELEINKCPEYLLELMSYKLNNEKKITEDDVVKIIKEDRFEMITEETCVLFKDTETEQQYLATFDPDNKNEIYWIAKCIN